MRELFDFLAITTILGIILWPFVWIILCLSNVAGFVGDVVVYKITGREVDSSPDKFRTILFLQGVFICVIYAAVFATATQNLVRTLHPTPSWPYPVVNLLAMLLFVALITRRASRRRDQELGAGTGMWVALAGYACFYKYPQILDSIPGAIPAFEKLSLFMSWLCNFWFVRDLLLAMVGLFFLIGAALIFSMALTLGRSGARRLSTRTQGPPRP
jgi:hypothetical protein